MVDIFELIRQKCPDGIPMQPIGKVAKICKGHELSRGKLSETKTDETPYPVMNMGTSPSGYWSKANREAGTITTSGHGMTSGALNWFDEPFFASDGCYVFEPTDEIMPRYLYYALLARHRFLSHPSTFSVKSSPSWTSLTRTAILSPLGWPGSWRCGGSSTGIGAIKSSRTCWTRGVG